MSIISLLRFYVRGSKLNTAQWEHRFRCSCTTRQVCCRPRLKCDGLVRFCERTSPFKSAGASVESTTGSRGVRISGSNAGHTMFRGSVKSTGYPLDSPISLSIPLPCVTVCHHISNGLYHVKCRLLRQFYGSKLV